MAQTLVSVVIPTYNCASYVTATIESVLVQTYRNWEIIVVDDGSTDDTLGALAPYGDKISYYHQNQSGVPTARNLGIQHARGDLVAFLDADDIWFPEKLSAQVGALLQFPEAGLAFSDMLAFDAGGVITDAYIHSLGNWFEKHRIAAADMAYGWLYRELLYTNDIATSTVLVRKDVLDEVGPMDETLRMGDDYDLWLRIARDSKFVFVNQKLIKYRVQSDGLSGPVDQRHHRWALGSIAVREKHLRKNWVPTECQLLVKQRLAQVSWELGLDYFTKDRLKESRTYLRKSVKWRAFDFGVWVYWVASFLPLSVVKVLRRVKRSTGLRVGIAPVQSL
jgi:glycosyltransferase involved in cell wall biosynthesis